MAKHTITFIPGDGTGPDVSTAARRCIEATGVDIKWDMMQAGETAIEKYKTPLPEATLESIRKNKVAIKGPITTPIGTGFRSVNVELRKKLKLYACVRPCRSIIGVNSRYKDIDLVIVRENTEDLYAGIEFDAGKRKTLELIEMMNSGAESKISEKAAISIKVITQEASAKIIKYAFEYAIKNKRKSVTAVHKANIMKYTDGLFMRTAQDIAKKYQGKVEFQERLVDNLAMQLVQKPQEYDVLLLPNLYGDIISDLCAGLIGGLGVAPGANVGDEAAVFEPTHGSAPKYKGQNKVNPVATILSGVLMLRHIGENDAAQRLEKAVRDVIAEGRSVTYDLKPDRNDPTAVGTSQMADAIIQKLKKG